MGHYFFHLSAKDNNLIWVLQIILALKKKDKWPVFHFLDKMHNLFEKKNAKIKVSPINDFYVLQYFLYKWFLKF